jgi:hypothetical protein
MRTWLTHVAVFTGVFVAFFAYCKIWEAFCTQPMEPGWIPHGCVGFLISGAGDESFDGCYIPVEINGIRCWQRDVFPDRYLWFGDNRWHLSREPGVVTGGYVTEQDYPPDGPWKMAGAAEPAPEAKLTSMLPGDEGSGLDG